MGGVFGSRNFEQPAQQRDTELTLTPALLLVMFVALVALCALCFGLGYSRGRRSSGDTAETPGNPSTQASTDTAQSKPPANPQAGTTASTKSPASPQDSTPDDDSHASGDSSNAQPQIKPALVPVNPAQAGQAAAGSVAPALAQQTQIMVQIAAVSQKADADVLVGALLRRGYAVSARREPLDGLIHVKIGPFKTPSEAEGWRQKLLNDGYNAEIQQ